MLLDVNTSQFGNPYLFSGREWDPELGYYYFRNRYMDPGLGRFVSRDPLGLWGDPLNLGNGYTYAASNPWSLVDPFGLKARGNQTEVVDDFGYAYPDPSDSRYAPEDAHKLAKQFNGTLWDQVHWLEDGSAFLPGPLGTIGDAVVAYRDGNYWYLVPVAGDKLLSGVAKRFTQTEFEVVLKTYCFVAGTPVLTSDGLVPIEALEVGDEVLTRNDETGELEIHSIINTSHGWTDELYDIDTGDGILSTTGNHRFWLVEDGVWVPAREIDVGDELLNADGVEIQVTGIESRSVLCDVYNIEIDTNHNYFVGKVEVLVHNGDYPEFDDYNQARNAALKWLEERGFRAEKQVIGRLGDGVGRPIGMSTADGKVGFRVEWDDTRGAHDHNAPKRTQKDVPHFLFDGTRKSVLNIQKRFLCK